MVNAIKDKFSLESEMIESSGGVFEVTIDDKLVFSKKKLDRFPEHEEIFEQIEKVNAKLVG